MTKLKTPTVNGSTGKKENRLPSTKQAAMTRHPVIQRPIDRREVVLVLRGTTPLITHNPAAAELRVDPEEKKRRHELPGPKEEYLNGMYLYPGATHEDKHIRVGFPASGVKKAILAAAKFTGEKLFKNYLSGVIHVLEDPGTNLIEVEYKSVRMREDMVRIGGFNKTTTLRYRPEFDGWKMNVKIRYDHSNISFEQLIALINRAGFQVGIGEKRPDRGYSNGCFEVVMDENSIIESLDPDDGFRAK